MIDPNFEMELEAMVDRHGLSAILNQLANICGEKADHIRSSYDDKALAKCWDRDGKLLAKVEGRVTKY